MTQQQTDDREMEALIAYLEVGLSPDERRWIDRKQEELLSAIRSGEITKLGIEAWLNREAG